MYICICRAVSDSDLKSLVEEGGADLERIQSCCGAGTECGSCLEKLKGVLGELGCKTGAKSEPGSIELSSMP